MNKPKHINSRNKSDNRMKGIYAIIRKDWKAYCLMAGILLIEEVSKPVPHTITKNHKGKSTEYECYHSLRLKMKDLKAVKEWFDITKHWERKLNTKFVGETFKKPKIEKYNGQFYINFLPNWLYFVMKTVNRFPSKYVNSICLQRLKNWRVSSGKQVLSKKEIDFLEKNRASLYNELFNNKFLAAGVFIVSFDLECRGITTGRISLCMSERYKDFLEFMIRLANNYGWSTKERLSKVKVEYSIKLGIKANPQHEFRFKAKKLGEIYTLAGPLIDSHKNKCLEFHIKRSKEDKITGKEGVTKRKILNILRNLKESKTTEIQFYVNIGIDVILDHLHKLEKEGFITKKRMGKRYIWRYKDAN